LPENSHIFIDESKSRGYLVAAAAVAANALTGARRELRGLVMGGQRRLHFNRESDGRRKLILDLVSDLAPTVVLYDSSAHVSPKFQREACLKAVVGDMAIVNSRMLVLETDDSLVEFDRKVLYRAVRELGCAETLKYQHLRAREEMLLAIPDAIAWCWQRQGAWQSRVKHLITEVRKV
jgi:hypothetical protein